jgi:hypothetical protein
MRDDREQGVWRRWYENGRPLSEGPYRDGVPDGAWRFWYGSGQIREAGEYRGGARRGRWRQWSVNGHACDAQAGRRVERSGDAGGDGRPALGAPVIPRTGRQL